MQSDRLKRREFIVLLGGAAAAWPLGARAQQRTVFRVAVLMGVAEHDSESEQWIRALLDGLSELGWKRDKNLQIDIRWAGAEPGACSSSQGN